MSGTTPVPGDGATGPEDTAPAAAAPETPTDGTGAPDGTGAEGAREPRAGGETATTTEDPAPADPAAEPAAAPAAESGDGGEDAPAARDGAYWAFAAAGLLVVLALASTTRFLEGWVPEIASGTPLAGSPRRWSTPSTRSCWACSATSC